MYSAQCKSHPLDSITHGRLNWKYQLNKISKEQQLQHAVSYNDVTLIMHRWKYFLVCKFLCIRIPSAGNAHTVWLHVYHFSLYIIIILCSYIIYIIGKCGHSPRNLVGSISCTLSHKDCSSCWPPRSQNINFTWLMFIFPTAHRRKQKLQN